MSAKHSPAPWAHDSVVIHDAKGEIVAFVAATLDWRRARANNNLILAAPDLLDVAIDFIDGTECQMDERGFCVAHGNSKPCRNERLLAAIRKAQGRQP